MNLSTMELKINIVRPDAWRLPEARIQAESEIIIEVMLSEDEMLSESILVWSQDNKEFFLAFATDFSIPATYNKDVPILVKMVWNWCNRNMFMDSITELTAQEALDLK